MSIMKAGVGSRRDVTMVVFVAAIFILAIVYSVFSATTINDNVNTGGTLTASGVSTLTGAAYASSTVQATGDGLFYDQLSAGASTNTPTTTFNVTGSGYFTAGLGVGYATTGSGNLLVNDLGVFKGRLGVNGTSSPSVEFGVTGSGLFSTGLGVGYATTGAGNLVVSNLGVFQSRLGVSGTTSPSVEFGVTGSGSFSSGLGVGYATTAGFKVGGGLLGVFDNRLGVNATTSPSVEFGVTGSGLFSTGLGVGYATTGTGHFRNSGLTVHDSRVGINATTSPYYELGVGGSIAQSAAGTTTISLESTGASVGGCIELRGGAVTGDSTRWVRIYVGGFGATNSPASGEPSFVAQVGGVGLLVIEEGRCK